MRELRIKSEEQAFTYLSRALEGQYDDGNVQLVFDNWPILEIRLAGKGYDSTITADIAEALISVQEALNRSYARLVRNVPDARGLSRDERQRIKFKAKVQRGSSLVKIDLGDYAKTISTELISKMTPSQLVITVLGLAVVAGGTTSFVSWANSQAEGKKLDVEARKLVALSEQETKRLEIVTKALTSQPKLKHTREDFDDARRDIVKSVGDAKSVAVNGKELPREVAQKIASSNKSKSKEVQLNGNYRIQKIDWQQGEDHVRMTLSDEAGRRTFTATLSNEYIRPEHREILKDAEWGRKAIYMSINANLLRGEVTVARIVGVAWPDATTNN